jgi:hypothetical protein
VVDQRDVDVVGLERIGILRQAELLEPFACARPNFLPL